MKKLVIIGGGIAGLSAGIFAQKNGFDSVILEKHHTLGGECTGWDRQGYHIDGCIHWLVGTKKGTGINDLWNTVGALDGVDCFHPESFLSFEYDGVTVHFYRDLDRLKSSWIELSPEDEEAIEGFYQTIKRLQTFEIPVGKPMDMMNIIEKVKFLLSMKDAGYVMQKYGKVSLKEYAKNFRHPALRETVAFFMPDGYSASSLFFALASFTKGQASIPYGGSKAMAMRMVERYLELGGTIEKGCEAMDLTIKENQVKSVVCKNNKTFEADYIVAACDPKVLYQTLLKGKYSDKEFEQRYNDPKVYPLASNMYVSIGYEGTIEDIPRTLNFPVNPFEINAKTINRISINNYQYEPQFAPKGHTIFTCAINQFHCDYDAWKELYKNQDAYKSEKARIGEEILRSMEERFPEMKGKLKVLDVVSPMTYERYCNAYRGAFMAFLPTIGSKEMAHTGVIKGLDNLFLSGQWLQPPGGLPVALITGKDTIMRICKKEKQNFIS